MDLTIKITKPQWETLKHQLLEDYPLSVLAIRSKMKDVLGFVDREHVESFTDRRGLYANLIICLDFYSEPKMTFFLLKYSEFLHQYGKTS